MKRTCSRMLLVKREGATCKGDLSPRVQQNPAKLQLVHRPMWKKEMLIISSQSWEWLVMPDCCSNISSQWLSTYCSLYQKYSSMPTLHPVKSYSCFISCCKCLLCGNDVADQNNSSSTSCISPFVKFITFTIIWSMSSNQNISFFEGWDHSVLFIGIAPAHSTQWLAEWSQ